MCPVMPSTVGGQASSSLRGSSMAPSFLIDTKSPTPPTGQSTKDAVRARSGPLEERAPTRAGRRRPPPPPANGRAGAQDHGLSEGG